MRCLVTGAAGFIGFHLCQALLNRGAEVWGIDDLSKGKGERLHNLGCHSSFHEVIGSLASVNNLAGIVKQVTVIYHLAAVVGVKHYVEDPVKVIETNVCQTALLLQMAQRYHRKIVFTSTSEIYGKSSALPFSESADRLYGPSSTNRWCYAISKSAAEHLCLGYAAQGYRWLSCAILTSTVPTGTAHHAGSGQLLYQSSFRRKAVDSSWRRPANPLFYLYR